MKKSFKIITFGCKINQHESDIISKELLSNEFEEKTKDIKTDYTIINSCTVTANADNEVLYTIRKIKNVEPDTKIILTGCLAQTDKDNLMNNELIFLILGNDEKLDICKYIDKREKVFVNEMPTVFHEKNLIQTKKTRATIKIQDGCNNYCTYCIVPFARGVSRSNLEGNIIANVRELADAGYKEIVLSGIHIGLWGQDFLKKKKLVDLLYKLEDLNYPIRYRLGSLTIDELDDETIEFLIQSEKFCNHLHISLQSANDKILKEMNRHNTVLETKEKLNYLNYNIKELNIGADVIVGFPGENDDDFLLTCKNIEDMPISYLHIFPYSVRKGTKAATMPHQVNEEIKKHRLQILKNQIKIKRENFLHSLIGSTQKVLVEKNKKEGFQKGTTSNYIKVLFQSDKNLINTVSYIKITNISDNNLIGFFVD